VLSICIMYSFIADESPYTCGAHLVVGRRQRILHHRCGEVLWQTVDLFSWLARLHIAGVRTAGVYVLGRGLWRYEFEQCVLLPGLRGSYLRVTIPLVDVIRGYARQWEMYYEIVIIIIKGFKWDLYMYFFRPWNHADIRKGFRRVQISFWDQQKTGIVCW
jgi:hypothetical protein